MNPNPKFGLNVETNDAPPHVHTHAYTHIHAHTHSSYENTYYLHNWDFFLEKEQVDCLGDFMVFGDGAQAESVAC